MLITLLYVPYKATVLQQADELVCHPINHRQGVAGKKVIPAVLPSIAVGHRLLPALKGHKQSDVVALGLRCKGSTDTVRCLHMQTNVGRWVSTAQVHTACLSIGNEKGSLKLRLAAMMATGVKHENMAPYISILPTRALTGSCAR